MAFHREKTMLLCGLRAFFLTTKNIPIESNNPTKPKTIKKTPTTTYDI